MGANQYWTILAAYDDDSQQFFGGVTLAWRTPGVDMLERRDALSVLWDICVHLQARGHDVRRRLFQEAVRTARQRGCRWLKIETQNTNVAACQYYARQGCQLRGIHPGAYAELPDEVHLLWYDDV